MRLHPMNLDPRSAGAVRRYHTWPHSAPQDVANHSWNVARILLAIWPDCPKAVLVEALLHDVAERTTGDLPYPVKKLNFELSRAVKKVEAEARLQMTTWDVPAEARLASEEYSAIKLADNLEMLEWAYDEIALGNKNARPVWDNMNRAIREILDKLELPPGVKDRALNYIIRRDSYERKHRDFS